MATGQAAPTHADADQARKDAAATFKARQDEPVVVLRTAYLQYVTAQACYEVRKSLAYQFVSEPDLSETRAAVKQIETALKSKLEGDPNAIWNEVAADFGAPRLYVYFDADLIKAAEGNVLLSAALKVARDQHLETFTGSTGTERLESFRLALQDPRSKFDELKAKCLDAVQGIRKALAKLTPATAGPKKDF
ncbi:hypothetical protein SLNSH_21855 [Alsobacter soli]|uniref:Uncharacterized protein n=1 Tax=Alsobacter soli TaxID=2109933 RepID=A0A2T1HMH9_9HYPH|nr:hypothetical protein SLNSH_21855 [Alsobacter soli]